MPDLTKALAKPSVECCVKAGRSLEMFCEWKNIVYMTKERKDNLCGDIVASATGK